MTDTGKGRDPIRSIWVHSPRLYKAIDISNEGSKSPVSIFMGDWFFKAAAGSAGYGAFNPYYYLLGQAACRSGYNV